MSGIIVDDHDLDPPPPWEKDGKVEDPRDAEIVALRAEVARLRAKVKRARPAVRVCQALIALDRAGPDDEEDAMDDREEAVMALYDAWGIGQ